MPPPPAVRPKASGRNAPLCIFGRPPRILGSRSIKLPISIPDAIMYRLLQPAAARARSTLGPDRSQNCPTEIARNDSILTVTITRPEVRYAVDAATASALANAFRSFDADETLNVAMLTGAGGAFCAGADPKAISEGRPNTLSEGGDGPMGPHAHAAFEAGDRRHRRPRRGGRLGTRAVVRPARGGARRNAGGLLPAIWRAVDRSGNHPAAVGLDPDRTRRFGRRSVAHGAGQPSGGIRRCFAPGAGAGAPAGFPRTCMRSDRLSCYEQWGLSTAEATRNEYRRGMAVLGSGETVAGARRFAAGTGRHGSTE